MKIAIPCNKKLLGNNLVHFEAIQKLPSDEFGDCIDSNELMKLHDGIIKIKSSGNNRLYTYVPYTNFSSSIKKFEKGQKLGYLYLCEELNPAPLLNISSVQEQNASHVPNGPSDTLTEGVVTSSEVNNGLKGNIAQPNSENLDNKNLFEAESQKAVM